MNGGDQLPNGGDMPMNQESGQGAGGGMDMAPFEIYEQLRSSILELLKQGLPGADQLLLSIDKIQAKNITEATAEGGQQGVNSPQAGSQYGQAPQ